MEQIGGWTLADAVTALLRRKSGFNAASKRLISPTNHALAMNFCIDGHPATLFVPPMFFFRFPTGADVD